MKISGALIIAIAILITGGMFYLQQKEAGRRANIETMQGAETMAQVSHSVDEFMAASEANRQSLDNAVTALADLAEAMRTPAAPNLEPIKDSVTAAIMLSQLTDAQIRNYSANILGRLGTERAEDRLLEMAKEDGEDSVRQAAFRALQHMSSKKLAPLLMAALKEGNPQEQQIAAQILTGKNIATKDMLPILGELLVTTEGTGSTAEQLRYYLSIALRNIGAPEACPYLLKALTMEDDQYRRRNHAQSLAQCATAEEIEHLGKVLEFIGPNTDPQQYEDTAIYILRKLTEMQDLRATKYILPFLKSQHQNELQTVLALVTKLRDPLAASALCEAWAEAEGKNKIQLENVLKNNYPGVVKTDGKYVTVDEEEMKEFIARREDRMKAEVEARKRIEAVVDIF